MVQQAGSRRALRDLVPATLATGAAGLVVSVLVGATTQGIGPALLSRGDSAAVTTAADLGGAASSAGDITVRVRPGRPAPLAVLSFLDVASAVPTAPEALTDVRGILLERAPVAPVAPAPAATLAAPTPAPTSLAAVAAPASVAAPATASNSAPSPSSRPKSKSRSAKSRGAELTAAGASEPVALAPASANDGGNADRSPRNADETPRNGGSPNGTPPNGPPSHAPAYGFRAR